MDLSIIIVNYGTYKLTKNTINSILKQKIDFEYEIFLVDSNSPDNSFFKLKEYFEDEIKKGLIKPIASDFNRGFAYANNIAIKNSSAKYILLLNSDTIVKKDTLNNVMRSMLNDENIGVLGCKVLLEDGSLDKASKRSFPDPTNSFYRLFGLAKLFPNNKKFTKYNISDLDDNGVYEVDSLTGAFMLVRSEAIKKVGLLDETFFMYGEDIDWCYRIKKEGWKILYYGKSEIIHLKGASSKKKRGKLIYEFYRAMYVFYNKHYKNKYSILTRVTVYCGIAILFLLKIILNLFKKN